MSKKKAIKLAAASAVAASAFVAAAPAQTDAASNVAVEVSKAVTQMKKAYHTYSDVTANGEFAPIADVYKEYNAAKKAYANAKALVNKAGGADKDKHLAALEDTYADFIAKRVITYIDAYNYATTLQDKQFALEDALKEKDWDAAEEQYHAISYELNTRTVILDRVYGKTTRELLRGSFKADAQAARDSIINEVSVKMYYDQIDALLEEGNLEEAEAKMKKIAEFVEKLDADTDFGAALLERVEDAKEKYNELAVPKVESVSAISATQAVVTFTGEIGEVASTNFSIDNGLSVIKAEVNADNKKEVKLTFNTNLTDRTDYKVTVNGVKSVSGAEMKEASTSGFTYEIGEVSKVELTKTTFVNGEDVADFVKITNDKGINVTDQYTVEVSSTSGNVTTTAGTVGGVTTSEVAYVQVTVKSGSTVVKTSDAIKVDLKSSDVTSLVSFGLGADVNTEAAYKQALKDGDLISEMKKSETPNLELLVIDNGAERLVTASDVTKIENLTPSIATVSVSGGELVVNAFSTGTAQAKLTIAGKVVTVSFTVKADSKIVGSTLSTSSVYFNTSNGNTAETSSVDVKIVDQYNKAIAATVVPGSPATSGTVTTTDGTNYTLSVKSSNTAIATATVDAVATADSSLPITISEVAKGTATITVELKDASGAVVFTKAITVNGKDAGAFAGYVIETDATAIDLDKDVAPEANDDAVNFTVYEVDGQGNKIGTVAATLDIQGYENNPTVKNYIDVSGQSVAVKNANATEYKTFAGSGTLNVDVKVNGTKIGTKAVSYSNSDSVASKAVVNTVDIVIDNDKVSGTDQALTLGDLFYGHYDAVNSKYTLAPKLSIQDQTSKVIAWDTATQGTLLNTDTVPTISFVTTNQSDVVVTGNSLSDTVTLASGKTSGSFTVVVSDIDTAQVNDILTAPVAFKVTIVD